ncbi:methyltransferase, TIGR04325 family [Castellaniella sp. MT123]|uniref:methyltransferase, TIGR04325 family n=1 Tax=Castellaniella sp. MT123 TaxID=3140381 RepID=UPI0031F38514
MELGKLSPVARVGNEYEVGFKDWTDAAKRATGYDAQAILNKVVDAALQVKDGEVAFERDTVTFKQREVVYQLFAWLMYAASREGALRVMDFGGALGSLYYQHRFLFDRLNDLRWGVVEQSHFVHAGRKDFEDHALYFFETTQECADEIRPNFLLLSSVIQYLESPYQVLAELLDRGVPYVLVDRTMARRGMAEEIAVQHVPPSIYDASYPLWLLDANKLESCFADHGYQVFDNFDPFPGSYFGPAGGRAPYQGWFLVRKGSF